MAQWCMRCGWDLPRAGEHLPCILCWDGRADDALLRLLIAAAEAGLERAAHAMATVDDPSVSSWVQARSHDDTAIRTAGETARTGEGAAREALRCVAQVDDRAAAPALREAALHAESRIRAAALRSLAWSGDRSDVPTAIAALGDDHPGVRVSARAALAELGGDLAADALADALDGAEDRDLDELIEALAWLRDPRGLESARRQAADPNAGWRHSRRDPRWAAVRLGDAADRACLRGSLLELVGRPEPFRQAAGSLYRALLDERPDEARNLYEWLYAQPGGPDRPRRAAWPQVEREPLAPREVPRLALAELTERPVGAARPAAKFGGQPDWIGEPAWPHTTAGRALTFYGQLPISGTPRRTAYIFINQDAHAQSSNPLEEGNAVILQPGAPSHLPTRPLATGPQLYEDVPQPPRFREPRSFRPYERFVRLEPGADPPAWTWPAMPQEVRYGDHHGDWNKVGGTGLWLQGEPALASEGWRFAFQFSAGWAGWELGDGAECYGFVRDDGSAALVWDCH